MAKKVYDTDGLDMRKADWTNATGAADPKEQLPVSGRLVENYIKGLDDKIDEKTAPAADITPGDTALTPSSVVNEALTDMVAGLKMEETESTYEVSFTQRTGEGRNEEQHFSLSKYQDTDKVVLAIEATASDGSPLEGTNYLALRQEGVSFGLNYTVSVRTAGGSAVEGATDLKARVIMKRAGVTLDDFKDTPMRGVRDGVPQRFDASTYLTAASTYTIQIEAEAAYNGETLKRTQAVRVTMVTMDLTTSYNVATALDQGGYSAAVNVPLTVKGTAGEKTVYYRINGGTELSRTLSQGSAQQATQLTIAQGDLRTGYNALEVYARHEASGVVSKVYYISLLRAGSGVADYVGVMFAHTAAEGHPFQNDWRSPVLRAEQFGEWAFTYGAYVKGQTLTAVTVSEGGTAVKTDSLPAGTAGSYGSHNVSTAERTYSVSAGSSSVSLRVVTTENTTIGVSLADGAVATFEAYGRTNTEKDPARWVSGAYEMRFDGVLWSVNDEGVGSGWTGTALSGFRAQRLLLSGGAGMTLYKNGAPFSPLNDAGRTSGRKIGDTGLTIEIEYATAAVGDTEAELITCLGTRAGNRFGISVTPEEAKFLTGQKTTATDAGEEITYEDSVGTKFEPEKNIKVTYVFYPKTDLTQAGLVGFYVGGEESAASSWADKNILFDIERPLRFDSAGADLYVKTVRIYERALTDDEVLDNYIVDRGSLDDTADGEGVRSLAAANDVLADGQTVSKERLEELIATRKNSILVLYGTGSKDNSVPADSDTMNVMDALAALNNKKGDKVVRKALFYNGEDRDLDFVLENANFRIQGTSSVNYARKNLRIYFQKSADKTGAPDGPTLAYGRIGADGTQPGDSAVTKGKKNFFRLRRESVPAKLACAKCDFSDSSMTTNTGGAKLIHDGLKAMGVKTPAQRYADAHADQMGGAYPRAAIDGLPCDLFVAKAEGDDLTYYGQYNLNNEKSDSYPIFGQDETIGTETWGEGDTLDYLKPWPTELGGDGQAKKYLPITLETLNNSNPLCLFQWVPSSDAAHHAAFLDAQFDGGFEFNHPKDTFWSGGKGDASEEPNLKDHLGTGDRYDLMYKAIDRMMSFLQKCVKETPAGKAMSYNEGAALWDGVDYADTADGKFPTAKWVSKTFADHAAEYFDLDYLICYYLYTDFNLAVDQRAKNMLLRTWDGVIWYTTYYDGDCQLGSDNQSFLTGRYTDTRETIGQNGNYVLQGHNSWLWNLLLANFADRFTRKIADFYAAFSPAVATDHFDTQQMKRWCSRLYNKSGIFKYVYPYLNPIETPNGAQTYPQIYGLKGSLKAHRAYFINRRYDLRSVAWGKEETTGSLFYISSARQTAADTPHALSVVLSLPYRIIIRAVNSVWTDSGIVDAAKDIALSFAGSVGGTNDPGNFIGGKMVRKLTWHEDCFSQQFNMSSFTALTHLDMSCPAQTAYYDQAYLTSLDKVTLLEELVMTNNRLARTDKSGILDLKTQRRLKRALLAGTGITEATFAPGAPLTELALPRTLTTLNLEDLPKLTRGALTVEGGSWSAVTALRLAGCPMIDTLALLAEVTEGKTLASFGLRVKLTADITDDGTLLDKYSACRQITPGEGCLYGAVTLTSYPDDEKLARWQRAYPDLELVMPQWTTLMLDEANSSPSAISNLDNHTGDNGEGRKYVPSGHVLRILERRFQCMMKQTGEGEVTVCPLHPYDGRYYLDGSALEADYRTAFPDELTSKSLGDNPTEAVLTGADGDIMLYEPHYWYKGVNDLRGQKKYVLFSSLEAEPDSPAGLRLWLGTDDAHKASEGVTVKEGFAVTAADGAQTFTGTKVLNDMGLTYSAVRIDLPAGWEGRYRAARWPAVAHATYGAAYLDAAGKVIKSYAFTPAQAEAAGLLDGMYDWAPIPQGAAALAFTLVGGAPAAQAAPYVWLSEADPATSPEALEPDWAEHTACLDSAVYNAGLSQLRTDTAEKLYARLTGDRHLTYVGVGIQDERTRKAARARGTGFQTEDYEMVKDFAWLYVARYGTRDPQCLYATPTDPQGLRGFSQSGTVAAALPAGMRATFPNPDAMSEAKVYVSDDRITSGTTEWDYGRRQIPRVCALGREQLYTTVSEWYLDLERCRVTGRDFANGTYALTGAIRLSDGTDTTRPIATGQPPKGSTGYFPLRRTHGRYLDLTPADKGGGSSALCWSDTVGPLGAVGTGLSLSSRGNYDLVSAGLATFVQLGGDIHYTRLAFRGEIKVERSVAAFRRITDLGA